MVNWSSLSFNVHLKIFMHKSLNSHWLSRCNMVCHRGHAMDCKSNVAFVEFNLKLIINSRSVSKSHRFSCSAQSNHRTSAFFRLFFVFLCHSLHVSSGFPHLLFVDLKESLGVLFMGDTIRHRERACVACVTWNTIYQCQATQFQSNKFASYEFWA